jgi:hypothetical protein
LLAFVVAPFVLFIAWLLQWMFGAGMQMPAADARARDGMPPDDGE